MKAVLIIFAWVVALIAAPVRIYDANVQNAGGNPANGRLEVQLSAPCTDVSTGRTYTQQKLTVPVAAGVVDVSLQPTTACRQLNIWYEVIYILSNDSERRRRVWRVPQSGAPHLVSAVEYEAPPAWGIPIGPRLTRTDQGLDLVAGALDTSYLANNAVSNAKLADMAAATLKGNNTGGAADPADLTVSQVKALLGYSAADLSNGVTGSGAAVLSNSPTLVTPTVLSFINATHSHQNAAGGGTLDGAAIASGTLADARVAASNVTQHQAALTIAESQVTGLTAALAGKSATGHTHGAGDIASGTLADARVAASNVTQHQAALSIATSQLTGLMPDIRIAASNVTQHQAMLSIAGSQLTGTIPDIVVASSNVTQHQSALAINATQVGPGTVDNTEFGYLNGVTSAIQTQLAGKSNTGHTHGLADITSGTSVPSAANTLLVRDASGGGYLNYLSSVRSATDGNVVPLETTSIVTVNNTGTYYAYAGGLLTQTAIAAGQTNSGYSAGLMIDVFRSGAGDLGTLASNFGLRIQYGHYQPGGVGARVTTSAVGMMLVPYVGMGTITDIYGIQVSPQQSGATVPTGYGIYMSPFGATNEWGIYQTSPSTQRNLLGATLFGSSTSQFSALVTVRDSSDARRNSFEWGHPNTAGYGNTIGFENSSGVPYVCFHCSAGTNTNTYKTWGNKGAVISATDGHIAFGRVASASADNQSLRVDGKFTDSGELWVYNNISAIAYSGDRGLFAKSGSVTTMLTATDASGGYGIIGTTSAHPVLFRVANTNRMQLESTYFRTEVYGHTLGSGFGAGQDVIVDVGANRTGSGPTYVDLISDTTYTDYGLRLIRYGTGPNTTSSLIHRGTGALVMSVYDAGVFVVEVGGAERMSISSTSTILRHLSGSGTAHVCADDNGVLSRCP